MAKRKSRATTSVKKVQEPKPETVSTQEAGGETVTVIPSEDLQPGQSPVQELPGEEQTEKETTKEVEESVPANEQPEASQEESPAADVNLASDDAVPYRDAIDEATKQLDGIPEGHIRVFDALSKDTETKPLEDMPGNVDKYDKKRPEKRSEEDNKVGHYSNSDILEHLPTKADAHIEENHFEETEVQKQADIK